MSLQPGKNITYRDIHLNFNPMTGTRNIIGLKLYSNIEEFVLKFLLLIKIQSRNPPLDGNRDFMTKHELELLENLTRK